MSKSRPSADNGQLELFELLRQISDRHQALLTEEVTPGSLDVDRSVRELVSRALKASALDRYEVASQMSKAMGREISKAMMDAFSSESKEGHRFPVSYLPAFVTVTKDRVLLKFLAEKAGGYFLEGEEALSLSYSNIQAQKRELARKEKIVRALIDSLRERSRG
jgi:hypothetical protein